MLLYLSLNTLWIHLKWHWRATCNPSESYNRWR